MEEATAHIDGLAKERIRRGKLELPALPGVALELMGMMDMPLVDAQRMSQLIHRDQGLAAAVLRVVNTPAFRGASAIVSLQQAIARLGAKRLGDITLAAAVKSSVYEYGAHADLMIALWRHGLATGLFAKEIARHNRSNVESAFLCGLLHGVGRAVLLRMIARVERRCRKRMSSEGLDEFLDEESATAGAMVAREWRLPMPVRVAIVCHGDWKSAKQHRYEATLTWLAHQLARWLEDAIDAEQVHNDPAVESLNLYPDDVDALLEQAERVRDGVASMT